MAEEYQRETAALNKAATEPPTASSLHDTIHKDGNYTFDNTTDSLEAIRDAVDGIEGMTAIEKSYIGVGEQPALFEYFADVADGADPNAAKWTTTEDSGGAVTVDATDTIGFCKMFCSTAGNDADIVSTDKWTLNKGSYTTLFFKTKFRMIDFTSSGGFGFAKAGYWNGGAAIGSGNSYQAGIFINNDTAIAITNDGGTSESTDIHTPGWINTDNTYYTVEIRMTASDVKFYIDGTLRVTHSTRVPDYIWQVGCGVRDANGTDGNINAQYILVWGE